VRQKECLPPHVYKDNGKTLFLSHTCALKDNENKDNENFVTKTMRAREKWRKRESVCARVCERVPNIYASCGHISLLVYINDTCIHE